MNLPHFVKRRALAGSGSKQSKAKPILRVYRPGCFSVDNQAVMCSKTYLLVMGIWFLQLQAIFP